jgi:hypothetical protein
MFLLALSGSAVESARDGPATSSRAGSQKTPWQADINDLNLPNPLARLRLGKSFF